MISSLFSAGKEQEIKDVLEKFDKYLSNLKPDPEINSEIINVEELFIKKGAMLDEIVQGEVLSSSFTINDVDSELTVTTTWAQNSFTRPHHHPKYHQRIEVTFGKLAVWNEEGSSDIITPEKRIRRCNLPECEVLDEDYCIPPGVTHRTQAISEKTSFVTIFSVTR